MLQYTLSLSTSVFLIMAAAISCSKYFNNRDFIKLNHMKVINEQEMCFLSNFIKSGMERISW